MYLFILLRRNYIGASSKALYSIWYGDFIICKQKRANINRLVHCDLEAHNESADELQ